MKNIFISIFVLFVLYVVGLGVFTYTQTRFAQQHGVVITIGETFTGDIRIDRNGGVSYTPLRGTSTSRWQLSTISTAQLWNFMPQAWNIVSDRLLRGLGIMGSGFSLLISFIVILSLVLLTGALLVLASTFIHKFSSWESLRKRSKHILWLSLLSLLFGVILWFVDGYTYQTTGLWCRDDTYMNVQLDDGKVFIINEPTGCRGEESRTAPYTYEMLKIIQSEAPQTVQWAQFVQRAI